MEFPNITSDINILAGKPCIKDTRISIDMILEWLASGASISEITKTYPVLSEESVKEAILFASRYFQNEIYLQRKNAV